jgi:cold shock CspA family protein
MKTALPGAVATGTPVTFTIENGKQNVQASSVKLAGNGRGFASLGNPQASYGGEYSGVIKSFNAQKGWGLISCEETHHIYGKDMFVLKTSLPGGHAEIGETAQFSVTMGEKGPEARNVSLGYWGAIKSFNAQKGWGLIACEDTFNIYGKDMFVLKTNMPNHGNVAVGTAVRFHVVQGEKGPEAREVRVAMQQRNGNMPKIPASHHAPMMMMHAPPRVNVRRNSSPMVAEPLSQRRHTGTIKSFNAEKGWGFVTPSAQSLKTLQNSSIFFMKTSLQTGEANTGDSVEFKVTMGQKGLNAIEISPLLSVDGMSGMSFSGTVKSYNAQKGWGFLTGDSVTQTFGRDVFFHSKDLGGEAPEVGAQAEFHVKSNAQGQPQATNLSFWSSQAFSPVKSGFARASPY